MPEDGTSGTAAPDRLPDPLSLGWEDLWERGWEQNLFEAGLLRMKQERHED